VCHRVDIDIDPEGLAGRGETVEVLAVIAFPLPGVADIRVVGAENHDAPAIIQDRSRARFPAVGSTLRSLPAGTEPEIDLAMLSHPPNQW
jgi:hypothetical protein